jgi:hypothetical protein
MTNQEHQRMLQEVGAGATMQMQLQELQKAMLHLQQHLLLLLLYLIALQLLLHDQLNKCKNFARCVKNSVMLCIGEWILLAY